MGDSQHPAVGIDLGGTNAYVAVMDHDLPTVVGTSEGRASPSLVAVNSSGRVFAGSEARAFIDPSARVVGPTLFLGRTEHEQFEQVAAQLGCRVVTGPDGGPRLQLNHLEVTPEALCARLLDGRKRQAERYLGQQVARAAVVVPAYFKTPQVEALRRAGAAAGLEVDPVTEAAAVMLAHGCGPGLTLVYHLGGKTFEATLINQGALTSEVLGWCAKAFWGGDSYDQALAGWLQRVLGLEQAPQVHLVERAKQELSAQQVVEVSLFGEQTFALKRSHLEQVVSPALERTANMTREMVLQSGVALHRIGAVLLSGAQTRMPLVRQLLEDILEQPVQSPEAPEEVAAIGACRYAADSGADQPLELDL